jgi:hypothetical protein
MKVEKIGFGKKESMMKKQRVINGLIQTLRVIIRGVECTGAVTRMHND